MQLRKLVSPVYAAFPAHLLTLCSITQYYIMFPLLWLYQTRNFEWCVADRSVFAAGYHLINVALHAGSSLFVYHISFCDL